MVLSIEFGGCFNELVALGDVLLFFLEFEQPFDFGQCDFEVAARRGRSVEVGVDSEVGESRICRIDEVG